jgi:hypothetical protein
MTNQHTSMLEGELEQIKVKYLSPNCLLEEDIDGHRKFSANSLNISRTNFNRN